jgi:hypothetical protein
MNKPREIGVSHRFSGRRSTCARGIVLLEVLVALGLLVMGLAVVGLQINAGLNAARSSDRSTRAVILAESKMAELRAGVLKPETQDEVLKGDFGVLYPGYTWLMFFEETETEGLLSLTMHICFDEELRTKQIDDPEMEVTVDERDYQPVYTVHRLYPENVYLGQKQDPFSGSDMGGFQQDSGGQQDENGGDGPPGESGPDGNNGGGIGAGSDFMLQLIQKVQSGEIDLTQFDETQSQIIDNAFKMFREGNFDKLQAYILSNQDEFSDLLDLPEDAQ